MADETKEEIKGPLTEFAEVPRKDLSFEIFDHKLIVRKLVAKQAEKAIILLADSVTDAAQHIDAAADSLVGNEEGFDSKAVMSLMASVLGKKAGDLAATILTNLENAKALGYCSDEKARFIDDNTVGTMKRDFLWTLQMDQILEIIAQWIDVEEPGKLLGNVMALLGDKLGSLMPEEA